MTTNVSFEPSNQSSILSACNSLIVNFVSGIGAYFWSANTTVREPAIAHTAVPLAAAPLSQTTNEALPIQAAPELTSALPNAEPPMKLSIELLPVMNHPFFDEEAAAAQQDTPSPSLLKEKQHLLQLDTRLKELEPHRFESREYTQQCLSAQEAYNEQLVRYNKLAGKEEAQAFYSRFGDAVRKAVLASLSIDNDEKALVSTQMIQLEFPNKPDRCAVLVTVVSETEQIEGILLGEFLEKVGDIRVLHFLTNEEIKHSPSETLLDLFPAPIVDYLQSR
jgi:hypothetical protein